MMKPSIWIFGFATALGIGALLYADYKEKVKRVTWGGVGLRMVAAVAVALAVMLALNR